MKRLLLGATILLTACASAAAPEFDVAKLDAEQTEGRAISLYGWLVGENENYGLYPLESDLWNGDNPCLNVIASDEVVAQVSELYDRRLKITGTTQSVRSLTGLTGPAGFCGSETYLIAERIENAEMPNGR